MPLYEPVWRRLVERHGLIETPFEDLVGCEFGDLLVRSDFDKVTSTIKVLQAGFGDCLLRFLELFEMPPARRAIPPLD